MREPRGPVVQERALRARVGAGLRRPANWLQLARFAAVGASGYALNLAVFTLAVEAGDVGHRVAATVAFLAAVTNNFWWNRVWTFRAGAGHAGFQAARFLAVSVAAFLLAFAVLEVLVAGLGAPEVPAQAVAVLSATPLNFLGNRMWSFKLP